MATLLLGIFLVFGQKGHLKPFGAHRAPEGPVRELADPSPKQFYVECVSRAEACIIRNVTQSWPAFGKWTNTQYLYDNFGEFNVTVEKKREDEHGKGKQLLKTFIDEGETGYVVTEMPGPMFMDVDTPRSVRCGNLLEKMVEVNFWLSSGDTAGIMHKDPLNQLNCVVAGRKDWTVIDPSHIRLLPMNIEDGTPPEHNSGGVALFKFESVDLKRFPSITEVPYNRSWVEAGDCIYMPGSYIHQVTSPAGRNIQVSLLFAAHTALGKGMAHYGTPEPWDGSSCAADQPFASLAGARQLNEHPVQWVYPGTGPQSMGFGDPARMRAHTLATFAQTIKRAGAGTATAEQLAEAFADSCTDGLAPPDRAISLDDLEAVVEAISLLHARGRWGIHLGDGEDWNSRRINVVGHPSFLLPADFLPRMRDAAVAQAKHFLQEVRELVGGPADTPFSLAELERANAKAFKDALLAYYTAMAIRGQYAFGTHVRKDKATGRYYAVGHGDEGIMNDSDLGDENNDEQHDVAEHEPRLSGEEEDEERSEDEDFDEESSGADEL